MKVCRKNGQDISKAIELDLDYGKPVIQIQSAAISSLYLNCGNEINVLVPALGTSYNPSFKTIGASHIKGAKKGQVTIIPTAPKVFLSVRSNGILIGTKEFTVQRVPLPNIQISFWGRPINLKDGEKASSLSAIHLKAVAEANFASLLPKDARYKIIEFEIILMRGSEQLKVESITGRQSVSLIDFNKLAKPGDRYVIEIKKVLRANYQNIVENVTRLPKTVFTISLY